MIKIEIIDTLDKLPSIEPVWNTLLAQSDMDMPFMTFEWFQCWWNVFRGKKEYAVAVAKENGETKAIAPFTHYHAKHRGLPVKAAAFMEDNYFGRTGIILKEYDPKMINALIGAVKAACRHDVLFFRSLSKGTVTDRAVTEILEASELPFVLFEGGRSPYLLIEGSWDDYWKSRSKNVRHKLNRISNLFERNNNHEIVYYTSENIGRAMEEIMAISDKTWQFKENAALSNDLERKPFYYALADMAARLGWLAIWVLRIGGKPVSFQLALRYKKKLYCLKTGFDEDYAQLSPSKFLFKHILQSCFAEEFNEVDFMGKDEQYKLELTSAFRGHKKYILFNNGIKGRGLYALERTVIPKLRERLKKKERQREEAQTLPKSA